jgi:hypothetical protein
MSAREFRFTVKTGGVGDWRRIRPTERFGPSSLVLRGIQNDVIVCSSGMEQLEWREEVFQILD